MYSVQEALVQRDYNKESVLPHNRKSTFTYCGDSNKSVQFCIAALNQYLPLLTFSIWFAMLWISSTSCLHAMWLYDFQFTTVYLGMQSRLKGYEVLLTMDHEESRLKRCTILVSISDSQSWQSTNSLLQSLCFHV